eukprot:TRINITY_DN1779_c9_g1_i1.p1 TRINITY_DN1779_c9_g1~~TRINITY_DN1779_c9_g1_i1.p1  ORF type:complete len:170 (+),score=44.74 TRINITY_DN1779_c9_g1_i1:107-616(+)
MTQDDESNIRRLTPNSGDQKVGEKVLEDQWHKIKTQRGQLASKDQKMNKMHHMLTLQGQQLEVMEKRRKREEELVALNVAQPQSKETLQSSVRALQLTLQEKEKRIARLTGELKKSLDQTTQMSNKMSSISMKLQEIEESQQAPDFSTRSTDSDATVVDISNNIICAIL